MEINFIDSCDSTQSEIINLLKANRISSPYCLVSNRQNAGVGSRGNTWVSESGNLYFSFCIDKIDLPSDLPTNSASIYFAYLMKEFLEEKGSKIWLKWPNDFYLNDTKIGGTITNKICENFICGIGLNLTSAPEFAGILDIKITPKDAVMGFLEKLSKRISWKQIFSNFSLEFAKSQNFVTHDNGQIISLKEAKLCEDGSIILNNKKVYSLR